MLENVKKETFREIVQRPTVLDFVRKVIFQSYTECAGSYAVEMTALLEATFRLLINNASDPDGFNRAMATIHTDIFKKQDPDFWFNRLYKNYKRTLKPYYRFEKLKSWLKGDRLLDFGCGDGLLSKLLQENGYQVAMCDVLDYRDELAAGLPFQQMSDPKSINFPDRSFDTTLVMAVLHHIEAPDLLPLLAELRRVTSRLIIEEDSYNVPTTLENLPQVLQRDPRLKEFMSLSVEDQLRCLMFIDVFGNVITQGLSQMDIPFNFKSVSEWQELFTAHGWQVTHIIPMGFQANQFNRSCHIWFVLD